MTLKEAFIISKREINPKINYIREIKEDQFLAQGSNGASDLIRYILSVKNDKLIILKIEEMAS